MSPMHHTTALAFYAAEPTFNPMDSVTNVRALLLAVIGVILVLLTILGLLIARKGNPGRNANILTCVVIALTPFAIFGIGAAVFANGLFSWIAPGFGK